MKKVKIMLTAIAVLAVVGGALAFKAKSPGLHFYQCDTFTPGGHCLIQDGSNTYKIDKDNGVAAESATVRGTDPGNLTCAIACPDEQFTLVEAKP